MSPSTTPDRIDEYLDAARACILDVGIRRTTLTDVARRAGVARMTLYRRWPDMQTLMGDLMTREWVQLATTAGATPARFGPQEIAESVVRTISAIRENALFQKIVSVDPEFLLPYLLVRRGRTHDAIVQAIAAAVELGQRDGLVRAGDARVFAVGIIVAAQSLVVSAQIMSDLADQDTLNGELVTMIQRYLA
ncbi:TetR family transcriptional regulator [Aeromicrobium sp. A1-2]|uniref:TetR/AcrR family transcriptional regulator n=1 Tax=Aeromicrobium sp. A1-2 TaxID=2107713 RepID=UPI000E5432D4|nr:TetR/AcrR family transcriptional regulator [Aeromicrobium sp. A1-2]AXT86008.1 TetR family transcriptional regulator [Aeromicrobium sp. A1-2]